MLRVAAFTVAILMVASVTIQAEPRAEIEVSTFSFGKVAQNIILTHTYWIKSVGDDTLHIESIWAGCTCSQIPVEDSSIAPGDSLPLTVIFNTGRLQGRTTKKPSIRTNAREKKIEFSFYAEVLTNTDITHPLVVSPDEVDVSQFGEKTRRIAVFHVENRSDEDLVLAVTDSCLKSFEVKLPHEIKAGETVKGKIRIRESKIQSDFHESLTFKVEGVDDASYSVPVKRIYYPGKE